LAPATSTAVGRPEWRPRQDRAAVHRTWIVRARLLASRSGLARQPGPAAASCAPIRQPDRVSALWMVRSPAREMEIIPQDAALCSIGQLVTAGPRCYGAAHSS
jgi:hypothetical protein